MIQAAIWRVNEWWGWPDPGWLCGMEDLQVGAEVMGMKFEDATAEGEVAGRPLRALAA